MMPNHILWVVAAALIDPHGRVLVQQRPVGKPMAGLWEFPGGKIDAGERPEAALARELHEEIAVSVDPAALVPCSFASEPLDGAHLVMLFYLCRQWSGLPASQESAALHWCTPSALYALPMPPADLPLIGALAAALAR
jgi:8-oxo-dGTP diphosphatase